MGQSGPRIMITTSKNPAEQSRTFAKLLRHVLPNAFIINRGNYSRNQLHIKSMEEYCDYIYVIHSRENRIDKLIILKIYADRLVPEGKILKFNQYIDHKIFGFHSLPETGPLSSTLEARALAPELLDYFQKYFFIEFDKKNALWLSIDPYEHRHTTFVTFIDAMTQRKFFYSELQLLNEKNHEHYID